MLPHFPPPSSGFLCKPHSCFMWAWWLLLCLFPRSPAPRHGTFRSFSVNDKLMQPDRWLSLYINQANSSNVYINVVSRKSPNNDCTKFPSLQRGHFESSNYKWTEKPTVWTARVTQSGQSQGQRQAGGWLGISIAHYTDRMKHIWKWDKHLKRVCKRVQAK